MRDTIYQLCDCVQTSRNIKKVRLNPHPEVPLFSAEDVVLVPRNIDVRRQVSGNSCPDDVGLASEDDCASGRKALRLVKRSRLEKEMVLPGELPVHLACEAAIGIETNVLLQIKESGVAFARKIS